MVLNGSLAATLDAVNEELFNGGSLSAAQAEEVSRWLAGRQRGSGSQAGLFVPTEYDYEEGTRLFTGEKLRTKLATRNVLTAEAGRVLALLGDPSPGVRGALERADGWLSRQCFAGTCTIGECAHSMAGLMRYLAAGEGAGREARLEGHVRTLSRCRNGKGRWQRFPFYYTLLALTEIDLPVAVEELRYAAPACRRFLRREADEDAYARRCRAVVQRALGAC
jgi:hypothetical protein